MSVDTTVAAKEAEAVGNSEAVGKDPSVAEAAAAPKLESETSVIHVVRVDPSSVTMASEVASSDSSGTEIMFSIVGTGATEEVAAVLMGEADDASTVTVTVSGEGDEHVSWESTLESG